MIEKIDGDVLLGFDLRSYNDGRNPYGDADNSIDKAWVRGIDHYRDYVQNRTGAAGHGRVLDLLCGFGRWTPFLAECNDEVVGIDVLEGCTKIASGICRDLGLDNVSVETGDVLKTKAFPDGHFDYVWMWSALQYVHRGETLAEVFRILKPGGHLYVGAYNGPGLMIDHVLNGARGAGVDTGASKWALGSLKHGELWNGNPNFLSPGGADRLLPAFGFECIAASEEGGLSLAEEGNEFTDFAGRKNELGLSKTVEFIARKPESAVDTESYLLRLLAGKPAEQNDALVMLREPGIISVEGMLPWLDHDNERVRENAATALASRGNAAVAPLQEALQDASAANRTAIEALISRITNAAGNAEAAAASGAASAPPEGASAPPASGDLAARAMRAGKQTVKRILGRQ